MVKHNNQIPNIHCKKKYLQSSRGPLKAKLSLNQATRKKARRLARQAKAAQIAPAPLHKLRPIVSCQTQKYSSKTKLGRGFTLEELKAVKIHPKYAMTIGIAVDWRRRNKSQESLDRNVARLNEYLGKLVVLKKDETAPPQLTGTVLPPVRTMDALQVVDVTDDMKNFKAFTAMRVARKETKVEGQRVAVENRKKDN